MLAEEARVNAEAASGRPAGQALLNSPVWCAWVAAMQTSAAASLQAVPPQTGADIPEAVAGALRNNMCSAHRLR